VYCVVIDECSKVALTTNSGGRHWSTYVHVHKGKQLGITLDWALTNCGLHLLGVDAHLAGLRAHLGLVLLCESISQMCA
jgi:hypothetical protein